MRVLHHYSTGSGKPGIFNWIKSPVTASVMQETFPTSGPAAFLKKITGDLLGFVTRVTYGPRRER
jgi:hypothetical protein